MPSCVNGRDSLSEFTSRKAEADEAASEAQAADDKAKKAMLDAAKIAEELRYEQENAQALERERKEMEIRAHDLQVQLDDAEQVRWRELLLVR